MNTYIQNISRQANEAEFLAIRASRADVAKLNIVTSGKYQIIPATRQLRMAAHLNVTVKTMRILDDGKLGYL